MQNRDYIESLIHKQQDTIQELETLISSLDEDKLLQEHEDLLKKAEAYTAQNQQLTKELAAVKDENLKLRLALNDQIIHEKLNILKISESKTELYFQKSENFAENRLKNTEQQLISMSQKTNSKLTQELTDDEAEIKQELNRINAMIDSKIKARYQELDSSRKFNRDELEYKYRQLQQEAVDPEIIQKRLRQNNLEIKFGLGWLNKIGIFLILLGVVTAIKFGYSWFKPELKGIFTYVIGLLFLGAGEYMIRKARDTFAKGLTSGGLAILYLATFSEYFYLHVMSMNAALIISVIITLAAIALSIRYDSKTISVFSLIGGYLPFYSYVFAFGLNESSLYGAMAYVFLLNTMVLIVSLYKKWDIVNYIAYVLNLPVFFYLLRSDPVGLTYDFAVFALFLAVVIGNSLCHKVPLSVYDLVLLGINTTVSCAAACGIFSDAGWNDYLGLLAVFFTLFYLGLGKAVEKIMAQEKSVQTIFYLTSLTFAVLIIPFQFDFKWLSMGWTVESVLMIIIGLRRQNKLWESMGWGVLILSYLVFLLSSFDYVNAYLYHYRFALITLGLIIAMAAYLLNSEKSIGASNPLFAAFLQLLKYLVVLNTFIYIWSESSYLYNHYIVPGLSLPENLEYYYESIIHAAVLFLAAYSLKRIKLLKEDFLYSVSGVLIILFVLQCLSVTINNSLLEHRDLWSAWIALAVLLAYHGLAFINLRQVILAYLGKKNFNLELYPAGLAAYLLLAVTLILSVQFDWISNLRFFISFTYIVLAFGFIYYGLTQRFIYIRRMGLMLSILASAKLFLIDLHGLSTVNTIIAYFAFGLVLLAISYLYQKMEKSLQMPDVALSSQKEEDAYI